MTYRNTAVLQEARHHRCQLCGSRDGTTVAAHANSVKLGKGMGHKAPDAYVAYLCHSCHHEVDQGHAPGDVRERMWWVAHKRSIPLFWDLLDEEGRELLQGAGHV